MAFHGSVHRIPLGITGGIAAFLLSLSGAVAAPPEPTDKERAAWELLQQPNSYFQERLQNPAAVVDGQTLHPKIQYTNEQSGRGADAAARRARLAKALQTPEGRAAVRTAVDRSWHFTTKVTADMAAVEDRTIPGPGPGLGSASASGGPIDIRIYRPQTTEAGPLPVLVYYHGGAWLFASIDAVDRAVRLIANEAQVIVVSVNYRLAPENPFPAAQDDALAAYRWVLENAASFGGDPAVTAIGGDSAGGGMALVTAMRQRDDGLPLPNYLLLYYPAVDMRMDYRANELFGDGYGLDNHLANVVYDLVFPTVESRNHPYASPLQADNLKGLPPTILATAGFDILRDQGAAMAKRLADENGNVVYFNYPSLNHGFMQHSGTIDDAERASTDTARFLGSALRSQVKQNAILQTIPAAHSKKN